MAGLTWSEAASDPHRWQRLARGELAAAHSGLDAGRRSPLRVDPVT